jgi:hypothetical protein
MATRARKVWRPNRRGYFERQIGWKISPKTGGHHQHKFTLGRELQEAQWREHRIRELWQRFEQTQEFRQRPIWPDYLLKVAKQIARGCRDYSVPIEPNEMPINYAERIQRLESMYPVISYVPQEEQLYEIGRQAIRVLNGINVDVSDLVSQPVDLALLTNYLNAESLRENSGLVRPANWQEQSHSQVDERAPHSQPATTSIGSREHTGDAGTLHMAFREYVLWLEDNWHNTATNNISGWGNTQRRQTNRLSGHHRDLNINELGFEAIDSMIQYWRNRPLKGDGQTQMSVDYCGNMVSQLKRFFDWLHTSRFAWRKPVDYSEIRTTIRRSVADIQVGLEQVETFSLDELVLLNRFATPLERIWVLLGLNCGFGMAETASLLVNQNFLFEAHEPHLQVLLDYESTDQDSFIKRVRPKSLERISKLSK